MSSINLKHEMNGYMITYWMKFIHLCQMECGLVYIKIFTLLQYDFKYNAFISKSLIEIMNMVDWRGQSVTLVLVSHIQNSK